MAKNIAGYISNLGKSVAYSTVDRVKQLSPATAEFAENNAELFKSIYSDIRDYKGSYTRGINAIKKSKVYEAADLGMKSIFEDIQTGKFYNKEREDRISSKIMGFDSNDFGSMDINESDSDFDIGSDDDFGNWGDDVSSGDVMVSTSINNASRSNAEMISMSVAKSAKYMADTTKSATHLLYTQNLKSFQMVNNGLSALNANMGNMLKFQTTTMQTHAENSKKYYEETTKMLQDQTALLRQLVNTVSPAVNDKKKSSNDRITLDDILGVNGTPNLKAYFKNIKSNMANSMGSMSSMSSMFGEDSNTLLAFVASPLKFIPNLIAKQIVPKAIETTFKEFDKSISGFFGSLVSKFNTMAKDEDNIIASTIGKIFGIKNSVKSSLDTANYNKAKVDWDGKSRKALIEVIPTQLSKIVSLLSGKPERLYDYDKGKFIDGKTLKDNYKNEKKGYINKATDDMREEFNKYMKLLTFNSLSDRKELMDDIDKVFSYMYNTGEMFNPNDRSSDAYTKYGISPKTYAAIKTMYKKSSRGNQHQINKSILEYRNKENNDMMNKEQEDSIIRHLFNDSNIGEFIEKDKKSGGYKSNSLLAKGGLLNAIDNKGKNVFYYLQQMYRELSYIRQYGLPGGGSLDTGRNGKRRFTKRPSFDTIQIADTSKKNLATQEREKRSREADRFEIEENRRREKESKLVNFSGYDSEKDFESEFASMIDVENIKGKLDKNKDKKKSIIDKLLEAGTLGGKFNVVVDQLNTLSKKPLEFFTKTIDKVDQRMYEVIYGKETGDGQTVKGFMDHMIYQLKSTFSKFNTWMDEKILNPIKKKLDIESMGDLGKKVLGIFGLDADEISKSVKEYLFKEDGFFGKTKEAIKNSFKGAYSTVKTSVKDAYDPIFSLFRTEQQSKPSYGPRFDNIPGQGGPIKPQLRKELTTTSEGKATLEFAREMFKHKVNGMANNMYDFMPHFDKGGYIEKSTVATVGEGEVVISKDNVNNLIGSLQQALGDHPEMARINRRIVPSQLGKDVKAGVGNVRSALFGDEAKDRKSMGLVIDDVTTNISRYAPEAIGSGLLGAGVSLITGAIGGPLLGAAVGAGMSLTKNSEKIQNYLFGEKINDERQGGLVSKDFMKSISKYLPDLKTYGIAGAATGLLPLLPFGPVGGLLLGSSFAFAKNNKAIQDSLFGEEGGLISPDSKEKIKKILPRMGLGAAIGLFTGPFGLVGNAMLGSGIGMLTTTEKFNQMILGNKDSDGKYQGGFLPTLRDTVIDPIKGYMKGLGDRITDFMKEKMFKPLASAFAPMKKQVELLTKGMFDKVGNFMNDMFEKSFGIPLNKFMEEKLIKPITGWLSKWILSPVKGAAKGIISAPFKLAGGIGNALRKSHIRSGNADYMTAAERMKFREDRNIYTMGLFGKDKFANVDRALAGMSGEDLSGIMDELSNVVSSEQSLGSQRKKIMNTLVSDLIPNFKYNESQNLMRLIQQGGSSKELASYIMNNTPHLSKEGRYKLLKQLSKNASKMKDLDNQRIDSKYSKNNLFNKLKKMGLDVNDSNINNYISLLGKESKSRNKSVSTVNDIIESPMETVEETSEKRHNKIVDLISEGVFLLKKIANPAYVASSTEEAKLQTNMKLYKGKSNPKKRKSGFTQIAGDGTALDYIVNSNGETVLDPSDNENREFIENQQQEKTFKNRFFEMMDKAKGKVSEGKEVVKEKSKGIFDSLLSGFGAIGNILKVAAIPAIFAYFKSPEFRKMINNLVSGVFGMMGDGISSALGFDNKEEAMDNALEVGARHVVTGGATSRFGLKWISKAFAPKDLSGKGFLKRMTAAPGQLVRKGVTGIFGLADKGITGVGNLLDKGVEAGAKSNIFSKLKDKAGKFGTSTVNAVSDAAGNSELIQGMINTMEKFMKDLITHPTVVRVIGNNADTIVTKAIPKIMKEVTERAAKAGAKAVAKVVGGLSTGGILNIIWAVADFISGFNDARNILGIIQEPSFGMKVCTGLIKSLNGLFIVTAFIPEETWVNLFLDTILPIFGKEDSNIQRMRDESRKVVEKYTKENGLDKMSVKDYNDMNKKSWWEKTKDTTKNIWNSVKNFGSRVVSSTKSWFSGDYKSSGPTQRPTREGGMGGERPNTKKRSKYKYVGSGGAGFGLGKGGENTTTLTEANIRYHDLRKLAGGNPTAASINQWIAKVTNNDPNSLMNGQGAAFMEAGKKYGLDPRYIAAHAAWESGWGRSEIVHAKNNFFGIAAYNASPGESAWSFKTPRDGILEGARFISEEYANAGQPTLHSMIHGNPTHRYAVYDDGSPNTGWIDGISNIFYNSPGIGDGVLNMDASSMEGDYSSNGSSGDSGKPSIFNMVTDLGTAFAKDFNKMMGFSNDEDPMSGGSGMSGGGPSSGNPADDFFTRTLGATVSSRYEENRSAEGLGSSHGGIDYAAKNGTTIKSPISGKVVVNGFEDGGFGNHVYVQDKNGKNHIFAHLNSRSPLKNGSQVKPGDVIGQVGNTGLSTGPHLHYEVRGNSRSDKSDPNKYLSQLYPNNELNSVGSERVRMELPEDKEKTEAKGGQNTNYDKLLIKIIEVLLKIADNSDSLSKIVDLLSNQMGMDIPNSTKKSLKNNKTSKTQLINIIKDSAINQNPDNEYLLNLLDGIATQ